MSTIHGQGDVIIGKQQQQHPLELKKGLFKNTYRMKVAPHH